MEHIWVMGYEASLLEGPAKAADVPVQSTMSPLPAFARLVMVAKVIFSSTVEGPPFAYTPAGTCGVSGKRAGESLLVCITRAFSGKNTFYYAHGFITE